MNARHAYGWAAFLVLSLVSPSAARGQYFEVTYPPSQQPGELKYGVTYTVWIPDGAKKLRGVIVHQHGCGSGACKGGATAAYDLHWQALAAKWDCALLGPSYHQEDKQDCRQWCDPRKGSSKTFLRCLTDLAAKSQHAELEHVPWCLWGHSGGAFWASLMQTMYPERIVAIWFRSGTAFPYWERGEIEKPAIPDSAYRIPMMMNPGAKENDDKRFQIAWTGSMDMFKAYRARGALVGFAADPRTAHECGDSRYLAIPFFDACLALRLPDPKGDVGKLRNVDTQVAWLAEVLTDKPAPASSFTGKRDTSVWLPSASVAAAWSEYVRVGSVGDKTPPPAPRALRLQKTDTGIELTWDADADFESGLQAFVVERDGKEIARIPEKGIGRFGRPLFQTMSYHDTPEKPLPAMRYVDRTASGSPEYRIRAINSVGLRSQPSAAVK